MLDDEKAQPQATPEEQALAATVDLLDQSDPNVRLAAAKLILLDLPLARHNMKSGGIS